MAMKDDYPMETAVARKMGKGGKYWVEQGRKTVGPFKDRRKAEAFQILSQRRGVKGKQPEMIYSPNGPSGARFPKSGKPVPRQSPKNVDWWQGKGGDIRRGA